MKRILLNMALKSLKKNKVFSLINIVGLSLSVAAFVFILYYVHAERSFDNFHADKDRIYRVESQFRQNGQITQDIATSSFGYAPAMLEEFPEIESACRINLYNHEKDLRYQDIVDREEHVFMVDSNFFNFFSYPLLQGDPDEVLAHSKQIVLSEKAAGKYFRDEDPIGKIIEVKELNQTESYTVSGVFKNIPALSNVQFDFLLSYDYDNDFMNNFWYMHEAYLYVKVPDQTSIDKIQKGFPAVANQYRGAQAMNGQSWEVTLVPLTQIHLNPAKPYELEQKGNSRSLVFLFFMAILILLIAWINFINLSTVSLLENRTNYSIMKAQGASTVYLFLQFLANSLVINLIALMVSVSLLGIALLTPGTAFLHFLPSDFWGSPLVWSLLSGSFIAGVLITGIIPGITLPSLNSGFRSPIRSNKQGSHLVVRKGLVITQYSLAIILVVSTVMIKKQLDFMQHQELGANINNILVFKTPTHSDHYQQKITSLKDEISRLNGVENIALSSVVPGQQVGYMGSHKRADAPEGDDRLFEMLRVDHNFVPLYQLELAAGRNFAEARQSDLNSILVNEEGIRWFGFKSADEAAGKIVHLEGSGNTPFTVLGVLKNYHQQSLKTNFAPVVFIQGDENYWIPLKYVSVKSASFSKEELVNTSREVFKRYFPNASFEYFFTDQYFNLQYVEDERFSNFFLGLSWLAIIVVCIGILGLSGFIMALRTKEIGIRKVNGATITEILTLLNKDFVQWVGIAFVIATPVAWYAMHRWLENFAWKTTLSWWIFAGSGALALGIALLTVSWQSWKAAVKNPIESLKYE